MLSPPAERMESRRVALTQRLPKLVSPTDHPFIVQHFLELSQDIRIRALPKPGAMRRPTDGLLVACLALLAQASALPSFSFGYPASREVTGSEDQHYSLFTHDIAGVSLPATYVEEPRLPVPPSASIREGGGWLSRWLAFGGEGELTIIVSLA